MKINTTKGMNMPTPFMTIKDASTYTGFSQFSIREGCKNGTVPHVMQGTKYLVDVEGFLTLQRAAASVTECIMV